MVLKEEETCHWQCDWSGGAPGHAAHISKSINIICGGYMILSYQLYNLVVCELNRYLSSSVTSVRLVVCMEECGQLAWLGHPSFCAVARTWGL